MKTTTTPKQKWTTFLRKEAKPLLITLLVLFAFRSAIADWNDVPTGSMKPTIMEGDRVFVNKLAYDLKVPFTTWHLANGTIPNAEQSWSFSRPSMQYRLSKRWLGLPEKSFRCRS